MTDPLTRLKVGHFNRVGSIAFSDDGGIIATGGGDGLAKIWSASSGEVLATIEIRHRPGWITFLAGGRVLATGWLPMFPVDSPTAEWPVEYWEVPTGTPIVHPAAGLREEFKAFFRRDRDVWLSLRSQKTESRIQDLRTGDVRWRIPLIERGCWAVSADRKVFATASVTDSKLLVVRTWDLPGHGSCGP